MRKLYFTHSHQLSENTFVIASRLEENPFYLLPISERTPFLFTPRIVLYKFHIYVILFTPQTAIYAFTNPVPEYRATEILCLKNGVLLAISISSAVSLF